jgi:hypothetical protein
LVIAITLIVGDFERKRLFSPVAIAEGGSKDKGTPPVCPAVAFTFQSTVTMIVAECESLPDFPTIRML